MIRIEDYLKEKQSQINNFLSRYLPGKDIFPASLHRAMRYSVLGGGKRLRGILVLTTGALFKVPSRVLMPIAAAFELVHTYSLIHDDLPSMDNDNFRRGRPACHRVFGEAMAILTGDALLTLAFQLVATKIRNPKLCVQLVKQISLAAGSRGMVGGQVLDITPPEQLTSSLKRLKRRIRQMHLLKTASLITAAICGGAILGKASTVQMRSLIQYGQNMGLAYQITDDLLDIEGKKVVLGKTPGKDRQLSKLTYPAFYGVKRARSEALRLITKAKKALQIFGHRARILSELADYVVERPY